MRIVDPDCDLLKCRIRIFRFTILNTDERLMIRQIFIKAQSRTRSFQTRNMKTFWLVVSVLYPLQPCSMNIPAIKAKFYYVQSKQIIPFSGAKRLCNLVAFN